jgi:hypothetical protein
MGATYEIPAGNYLLTLSSVDERLAFQGWLNATNREGKKVSIALDKFFVDELGTVHSVFLLEVVEPVQWDRVFGEAKEGDRQAFERVYFAPPPTTRANPLPVGTYVLITPWESFPTALAALQDLARQNPGSFSLGKASEDLTNENGPVAAVFQLVVNRPIPWDYQKLDAPFVPKTSVVASPQVLANQSPSGPTNALLWVGLGLGTAALVGSLAAYAYSRRGTR